MTLHGNENYSFSSLLGLNEYIGIYCNFLQFYALERDKAGSSALAHMLGLHCTNEYPIKGDVVMLFSSLRTPVSVFRKYWTEPFHCLRYKRLIATILIQIFLQLLLFSEFCMKDMGGKRELVKHW